MKEDTVDHFEQDTRNDLLKKREAYALTAPGSKLQAAREFESEIVAKMLLDGRKTGEIWRFMSNNFNISTRTTDRRIKRAWEILRELSDNEVENSRAIALNRLDYLYREAKNEYDKEKKKLEINGQSEDFIPSNLRKEMMVYTMESARLKGIYDPKNNNNGNQVVIINGSSIEEIAEQSKPVQLAAEGVHRETDSSSDNSDESTYIPVSS